MKMYYYFKNKKDSSINGTHVFQEYSKLCSHLLNLSTFANFVDFFLPSIIYKCEKIFSFKK